MNWDDLKDKAARESAHIWANHYGDDYVEGFKRGADWARDQITKPSEPENTESTDPRQMKFNLPEI